MKRFLKKIFFPFKWLGAKIGSGLKYVFVDKTNKVFLVIVPNFLFKIVGTTIVIYGFKNIKQDTTGLTNYGFAILAGIASVCFSWTRGLDREIEPNMIERISRAGEGAFHCAVIFLLASALKYSSLHLIEFIPKSWSIIPSIIAQILNLSYSICFTLGLYKVTDIICDINKLLYERLHMNQKN